MNDRTTSHRHILKASSIIGGASVINMVIGIAKVKMLAILLGPAGVGLMGLYQNIMGMAATLAGCGIGTSGVRQLAASAGEASTLALVRRTLWLPNLILGLTGIAMLWLLRDQVSNWVFADATHAGEVGWLGLGVLLTLIAGSQTALLQGMRRIGDLARVSIISAFFGAILGIALVYWLGESGVLWFVLTAPIVSILVAGFYANRLPKPESSHDWQVISQQWKAMLKLGIPLMATGLLTLGTQLAARTLIVRELRLDASGYFQAAWAISMTYIGFVLSAMGSDFYPRLTAAIKDHPQARRLVNDQSEMALLLAGPVLLAMVTLAPWIINLPYSTSFAPATDVLRWQVLGDILKVASWPMGFILLAQGQGGLFIGVELVWNVAYLGAISIALQQHGLVIAGVGFWISYMLLLGVKQFVAYKLIGLKPARRTLLNTLLLSATGGLVIFLDARSANLGHGFGLLATLVVSAHSLRRLDHLVNVRGWLKRKFAG